MGILRAEVLHSLDEPIRVSREGPGAFMARLRLE